MYFLKKINKANQKLNRLHGIRIGNLTHEITPVGKDEIAQLGTVIMKHTSFKRINTGSECLFNSC